MNQNYDELIRQQEEKLSEIKIEMGRVANKFIEGVIEFTKKWFESTAKRIITENADLVSKMNVDQLKNVKNEVKALINESEHLINAALIKKDFWWHLKENDKNYSSTSFRAPSFIEKEISIVFGRLGTVLSKYNLINLVEKRALKPYEFVEFAYDNQVPIYSYGIGFPDNLNDLMQKYGTLHEQAKKCRELIKQYEDQKKKDEIENLWESL